MAEDGLVFGYDFRIALAVVPMTVVPMDHGPQVLFGPDKRAEAGLPTPEREEKDDWEVSLSIEIEPIEV